MSLLCVMAYRIEVSARYVIRAREPALTRFVYPSEWVSPRSGPQGVVFEDEGVICESVLTVSRTKEVTAGTS